MRSKGAGVLISLLLAAGDSCDPANTAFAQCPENRLVAPDGGPGDQFGKSVAVDGGLAAVGSWRDDDLGADAGAVYLFTSSSGVYGYGTKLVASDGSAGDNFGRSIDLVGDVLAVGTFRSDRVGLDAGAVHVFRRQGALWSEEQILTASDADSGDAFGFAVRLTEDRLVVGAPDDDEFGIDAGAAYVFDFDPGSISWSETQKLAPGDPQANTEFGSSAGIDQDRIVVGSFKADGGRGAAYVFHHSGTWIQEAKLIENDPQPNDRLGKSVAISGERVLAGARSDDGGVGSAIVFRRDGVAWSQEAKLTGSLAATGDSVGFTVSLSGDAALVGAPGNDAGGSDAGNAYLFTRNGTTWTEQSVFLAQGDGDGANFGWDVALRGGQGIVGAIGVAAEQGVACVVEIGSPACLCGVGTVDAAAGGPVDVLTVNGATGLPTREVIVSASSGFAVELVSAPTPALGSAYYAAIWPGRPDSTTTDDLPAGIGFGCFQPFTTKARYTAPLFVANTFGTVSFSLDLDPATTEATGNALGGLPVPVLVVPASSLQPGEIFTVQGIVGDGNSTANPGKPASVTNAVVLIVD